MLTPLNLALYMGRWGLLSDNLTIQIPCFLNLAIYCEHIICRELNAFLSRLFHELNQNRLEVIEKKWDNAVQCGIENVNLPGISSAEN